MTSFSNVVLFVFVLVLFSCATPQGPSDIDKNSAQTQVSSDGLSGLDQHEIATVAVEETSEKTWTVNPETINGTPGNTNLLAINFGPGYYRTLSALSWVRCAEEHGLKFSVVTGIEMGAVMAVMFAMDIGTSKVEWVFYKMMQATQKMEPYSEEWMSEFKKHFGEALRGLRIEDAKRKLAIPIYDRMQKKIVFLHTGNLMPALEANLRIEKNMASSWSSPALFNVDWHREMAKFGADKFLHVSVLGVKAENIVPRAREPILQAWDQIRNVEMKGRGDNDQLIIIEMQNTNDISYETPRILSQGKQTCVQGVNKVKSNLETSSDKNRVEDQ